MIPATPAAARVSTLELFFDLVFVFTLTQLTVLLVHGLTWTHAGQVLLIFTVLFWMYAAYAYLTNQVPPDRPSRRLWLIAGMAAFLVCALAIPHAFADRRGGLVFGAGYLLVVLVHGGLYTQAHGRVVLTYAPTNVVGAGFVIAAGFTDGAAAYALWLGAIAMQFANTVALRRYAQRAAGRSDSRLGEVVERLGSVSTAHFTERHGLLLLVAFGESVVAIGAGLGDHPLDADLFAGVLLGLALAAGLWWAFFVRDDEESEQALLAVPVAGRWRITVLAYYYAFIPMLLGVVVLAAGVKKSIGHLSAELPAAPALALAGGVALYLAGDVCFRLVLRLQPLGWRAAAAVCAMATVPLGVYGYAAAQLVVLVAVIAAMLVVEARAGARSEAQSEARTA